MNDIIGAWGVALSFKSLLPVEYNDLRSFVKSNLLSLLRIEGEVTSYKNVCNGEGTSDALIRELGGAGYMTHYYASVRFSQDKDVVLVLEDI